MGISTVTRTVARKYFENGQLGASFFFSRGVEDVGPAGKLFTTIAVQLARKSPTTIDLRCCYEKRRFCDSFSW
jgi:hypothetical protein